MNSSSTSSDPYGKQISGVVQAFRIIICLLCRPFVFYLIACLYIVSIAVRVVFREIIQTTLHWRN